MVTGYPVDIFFWGEYFSMMGVFLLSFTRNRAARTTRQRFAPFGPGAAIFRMTAKKKDPNQVLDNIRWLNPRMSPCFPGPKYGALNMMPHRSSS
jgi:hypothetical protein